MLNSSLLISIRKRVLWFIKPAAWGCSHHSWSYKWFCLSVGLSYMLDSVLGSTYLFSIVLYDFDDYVSTVKACVVLSLIYISFILFPFFLFNQTFKEVDGHCIFNKTLLQNCHLYLGG